MGWKILDNSGRVKQLSQMYGFNPTQSVLTASSGTYTPPTGCTAILVEVWGSGGGGGQAVATNSGSNAFGSGGGGGGYASLLITNPAASYAYAVGAGGTSTNNGNPSSFGGTLVSATGGSAGGSGTSTGASDDVNATSGAGGSGTNGSVLEAGGGGTIGFGLSLSAAVSGAGGAGANGGGGGGSVMQNNAGNGGRFPGGGGSGGANASSQATNKAGGTGGNGQIIVTEFYGVSPTVTQSVIPPTQTIFTSGSGTYTPPTAAKAIKVECLAGGGGGGSAQTGSNATYAAASGGSGGGYASKLIQNPATSYAYSVGGGGAGSPGGTTLSNGGTGGDTTFGSSTVVAKGGGGGHSDGQAGHTSWATTNPSVPSDAGAVGDYHMPGDAGTIGIVYGSGQLQGGGGGRGAGPLGGPGPYPVTATSSASGSNGIGYGSGGGGSVAGTFSGGDIASGTGAGGIIVITEYYGANVVGATSAYPFGNYTTQNWAVGPPSSPQNGDVWYATNVDSSGTVWTFKYNANSTSPYRWEFVGGPPFIHEVDASETTTTAWSTLVDLTTVGPIFTAGRGGDYQYVSEYRGSNNTANIAILSTVVETTAAGAAVQQDSVQVTCTSATANASVMGVGSGRLNGVTAGDGIRMRYCVLSTGTGTFMQRRMQIWPVRIA